MEEETTTPAPAGTGVEPTQPVTTEQAAAVEVPAVGTEQPTTTPAPGAEEETTAASDDAQLDSWAEKKGLVLDSDNARKIAKMAHEAEKNMHEKTVKASELEKTVTAAFDGQAEAVAEATGQDTALVKAVQTLQIKDAVRDFWSQPGIDRAFEPAMVETLKERPDLKGDLESLYAVSVMRSGGVAKANSQGKREALESLAHKQQAAVPSGSATTNASPKGKSFGDLSIKEMEKQLGFAPR